MSGRIDALVEVLVALARQDFSARAPVSEARDELDAIATGVNILAEELNGEVASRRELEAAYAALKDAQAQLVQASRLAALGELASGVAHEINNPAAWVQLAIGTARRRLAARDPATDVADLTAELDALLADAEAGMERIRVVARDLRTFSSAERDEAVPLTLDEIVRSAARMARPAWQPVAELALDLGEDRRVLGHAARLGQLVTNLIVNAAHAVGACDGERRAIAVSIERDGDAWRLAVEDSGPGIPRELRERVFEPFFTTKPTELGTGLGLALVRQIARQHGGDATASDGRLGGARIEVRLPRHAASEPAAAAAAGTPCQRAATDRPRVLVIDDEPLLGRALEDAMSDAFDVVVADGGQHALDQLARDDGFDAILCDLQMPGVDGAEVHAAVAARWPALLDRLVFITAGVVTERARAFVDRVRPQLLPKPFDAGELVATVGAIARSSCGSTGCPQAAAAPATRASTSSTDH